MAGPVITIVLPVSLREHAQEMLDAYLRRLADHNFFEHPRPGHWALNLEPERLGIAESDREGSRPFLVNVEGPGYGDGDCFEDGRYIESDWGFLPPLLGFTPANMIDAIAMCNGRVDHIVTALMTADIMDIVHGVAFLELWDGQVEPVRALPGVLAAMPKTADGPAFALGDGRFLRAFAATPGFRLRK